MRLRAALARSALLLAAAAPQAIALPSAGANATWSRVAIRSAAFAAAGRLGGEGCQVVRTLGASRANPDFLLLGADVGGVHRSLDGGASWAPAMVGWHSRGATAFAFDDADARHVLGVGGNSNGAAGTNGVHVSFDGAASWSFVLPIADADGCMDGSAIAFDPAAAGAAAFFSSGAGLWRSTDAGRTWALVSPFVSTACLALDSTGHLWAASNDYRSFGLYSCGVDYAGAANCSTVRNEYTTGLDIEHDAIFISNWAGVEVSTDGGASFRLLPGRGLPAPGVTPVHHVAVSPANASLISAWYAIGPYYNTTLVVSHDGGASFAPVAFDNADAFMPFNGRDGKPVWHATNASVAWNAGGDWPTRSDDGGQTLRWSGAGYNVVMVGGSFGFSLHAPDAVFLAFQDYGGAHSTDGGASFTSVLGASGISGNTWGGFDYAGFALNRSVLFAGDAPSWTGPRTLRVSFDGGGTWATARGAGGAPLAFAGPDASAGDPLDPLVAFASNLRTADGAATWAPMAGCAGVLTADAETGALYGVSDNAAAAVVRSTDHGVTWQPLFAAPGPAGSSVRDLAVDGRAGAVYVVAGDGLFKCAAATGACDELTARLPPDQEGGARVRSVAVDPVDPSVVYASATRDIFLASNAVARSVDGGATFENLILAAPLAPGGPLQGPHEVGWLRVHPVTRELWAAGECFGVWKVGPPA